MNLKQPPKTPVVSVKNALSASLTKIALLAIISGQTKAIFIDKRQGNWG